MGFKDFKLLTFNIKMSVQERSVIRKIRLIMIILIYGDQLFYTGLLFMDAWDD